MLQPLGDKIIESVNTNGSLFGSIIDMMFDVKEMITRFEIKMIMVPSNADLEKVIQFSKMNAKQFAESSTGKAIITNHFSREFSTTKPSVPSINGGIIDLSKKNIESLGVTGMIQPYSITIVFVQKVLITQEQINALQTTPTMPIPINSCSIVTGEAFMAQIICGQLSIGPNWKEIMMNNRCTKKGFAIAESLIKIASTRIFSIPEQSIMEPIVNSIDSYNPERKVGKFGMGFFSLMYWLMKDPKSYMAIKSVYRIEGVQKPCGFDAMITNRDGHLHVAVSDYVGFDLNDGPKFSVSVSFGSSINSDDLGKFEKQLTRLGYVSNVQIIVNDRLINHESRGYNKPSVNVKLSRIGFDVLDRGTGVSIDTFYSSLIVPSISSKTIVLSDRKDTSYVDRSRVVKIWSAKEGTFKILVGDIVIVSIGIEDNLLLDYKRDYLLTLPMNTRVPVSRDDVLLGSVKEQVIRSLENLLDSSIKEYQDTVALENGINAFIAETASNENVRILNEFVDFIPFKIRAAGLFGVEIGGWVFPTINIESAKVGRPPLYISTLNPDQARLEAHILSAMKVHDGFFLNRKVVFINPLEVYSEHIASTGGTASFIFVSQKYVDSKKDWPTTLALEYKQEILYPVGAEVSETLAGPIIKILASVKNDRHRKLMSTIIGRYQNALNFREPHQVPMDKYLNGEMQTILLDLQRQHLPLMTETDFETFLSAFVSLMSDCQPKVSSYGKSLTISTRPFFGTSKGEIMSGIFQRTPGNVMNVRVDVKLMLIDQRSKDSSDMTTAQFKEIMKTYPRHLFEKASYYQAALMQNCAKAVKRNRFLEGAQIIPFATMSELKLPLEIFYLFNLRSMARSRMSEFPGNRSLVFDAFISESILNLLEISDDPYQFIIAYLIMHRSFSSINTRNSVGLLVTALDVITPMQLAKQVKSILVREYGRSINQIFAFEYLFYYLGLEGLLEDVQFNHFFFEIFRFRDDLTAWLEKQLKISTLVQEVSVGIPNSVSGCYNFTLSKMIAFVFQHELPATANELFSRISQFTSKVESKLQVLEIAISEGSSKAEIPAKLTETVQNSLDAIRMATIPNAKIQLTVKKLRGTNDLLLGITDPVGIPFSGLIAISIPFLSDKQSSELVTGEIGSGFFNVYRGASKVMITTTRDGETITMIDTPILDPSNNTRVLDIQRCASVSKTPSQPNGTTILIQSKHTDDTLTSVAIDAITFCRDTIGLINDAKFITLNNESISIPLTKIFENEHFEFHMSKYNFTSYIMTKGVPFAPLHNYITSLGLFNEFKWLLDQFRMNVRLNIKSGVFTPVQTRTKIGLSDENILILVRSMLRAMFFVVLYRIENGLLEEKEIDSYLQYYSSNSSPGQVLPGDSDSTKWHRVEESLMNPFTKSMNADAMKYMMKTLNEVSGPFMVVPFSDKPLPNVAKGPLATLNFRNLIHDGKESWPEASVMGAIIQSHLEIVNMNIKEFPGKTIFKLALSWLVNKKEDKSSTPSVPKTNAGTGKKVKITYMKDSKHMQFIKVWIRSYCQLAQRSIQNFPQNCPNVEVNYEMETGIYAAYTPAKNVVDIYYEYVELNPIKASINGVSKQYKSAIDHVIEIFTVGKDLNSEILNLEIVNPVWRSYFMPKGNIAHEMEHFRAGGDHKTGAHGDITMNLPYGGNKKRIFLMQHHDSMVSLVQTGFYEMVKQNWMAFLQGTFKV